MAYRKKLKLWICRFHFLCKNMGVQTRCKHCIPHFHSYKDTINGVAHKTKCDVLAKLGMRDINVCCIELLFHIKHIEKNGKR